MRQTKTIWDCTLRTQPVSDGKVSPCHTNISGSRLSIKDQECKWLLNFAPTNTGHSGMSLTAGPAKTVTQRTNAPLCLCNPSTWCLSTAHHPNPLTDMSWRKELRSCSRSLSLVPNSLLLTGSIISFWQGWAKLKLNEDSFAIKLTLCVQFPSTQFHMGCINPVWKRCRSFKERIPGNQLSKLHKVAFWQNLILR